MYSVFKSVNEDKYSVFSNYSTHCHIQLFGNQCIRYSRIHMSAWSSPPIPRPPGGWCVSRINPHKKKGQDLPSNH